MGTAEDDVELQKSNILLLGPTGCGKTLPRADARADPQRPVRDRRRDRADGGRLRRRGRREHPAQADPGRRLRHQEGRDRDHLHRRGRQDRAQGGQPVDHARRVGRGRPAGAAEDPRGHGRLGAAAGRAQAPAPGVPLDRHDEHPLHLRRRVRRAREDHRARGSARTPSASAPRSTRSTRAKAPSCSPQVMPEDLLSYGLIPEFIGRLPVVSRRAPAAPRGPRPDPRGAEERARQAVPALLQLRHDRARLHRRRALGDRRARRSSARPAPAACARSSRTRCST